MKFVYEGRVTVDVIGVVVVKLKNNEKKEIKMTRTEVKRKINKKRERRGSFTEQLDSPYAFGPRPGWIVLGHCVAATPNWVAWTEVSRVIPPVEAMLKRLSHLGVEEAVEEGDGEALNTEQECLEDLKEMAL